MCLCDTLQCCTEVHELVVNELSSASGSSTDVLGWLALLRSRIGEVYRIGLTMGFVMKYFGEVIKICSVLMVAGILYNCNCSCISRNLPT